MEQNAIIAGGSAAPDPLATPPNVVRLRDGHTVMLHREATPALAVGMIALIEQGASSVPAMLGRLTDVYLELGIAAWDYLDERGRQLELSAANIREKITVANGAIEVAEAANSLYLEAIANGPLAERSRPRSPTTPTESSTPPTSDSGSTLPTPPEPSSPTASAGTPSEAPVP